MSVAGQRATLTRGKSKINVTASWLKPAFEMALSSARQRVVLPPWVASQQSRNGDRMRPIEGRSPCIITIPSQHWKS